MNLTELDNLELFLMAEGIPYTRYDQDDKRNFKGFLTKRMCHKIEVDDPERGKWYAICHRGSWGYEDGLLEVWGDILSALSNDDRPLGWMTAKGVIDILYGKK